MSYTSGDGKYLEIANAMGGTLPYLRTYLVYQNTASTPIVNVENSGAANNTNNNSRHSRIRSVGDVFINGTSGAGSTVNGSTPDGYITQGVWKLCAAEYRSTGVTAGAFGYMSAWNGADIASTRTDPEFSRTDTYSAAAYTRIGGDFVGANDGTNLLIAGVATWDLTGFGVGYVFTVSGVTVSPTVGAVYNWTSGSHIHDFTVTAVNISGGSGTVTFTGTGDPYVTGTNLLATSGTLSKTSGTGDATLTWSAFTGGWTENVYQLLLELSQNGEGSWPDPRNVSAQAGQLWSGKLLNFTKFFDDTDLTDLVGGSLTFTATGSPTFSTINPGWDGYGQPSIESVSPDPLLDMTTCVLTGVAHEMLGVDTESVVWDGQSQTVVSATGTTTTISFSRGTTIFDAPKEMVLTNGLGIESDPFLVACLPASYGEPDGVSFGNVTETPAADDTLRVSGTPDLIIGTQAGFTILTEDYGTLDLDGDINNVEIMADGSVRIAEEYAESVSNQDMTGAAAPSTLPTDWDTSSPVSGITREVVQVIDDSGMECIDIRFYGTPDAPGACNIRPMTNALAAPALHGQIWKSSMWVRLVAGSLTNVGDVSLGTRQYTSGGALVDYDADVITLTGALIEHTSINNLTGGVTVAKAKPDLNFDLPGGAVDFTIRVGLPSLKRQTMLPARVQFELNNNDGAGWSTSLAAVDLDFPVSNPTLVGSDNIYGLFVLNTSGTIDLTEQVSIGDWVWTLFSGSLPNWAEFDANAHTISGTPGLAGDYDPFVIRVSGDTTDIDITVNISVLDAYTTSVSPRMAKARRARAALARRLALNPELTIEDCYKDTFAVVKIARRD
jgi:hypothetical protein